MKNFILLTSLFSCLTISSFAGSFCRNPYQGKTDRAMEQTRKITEALRLNEMSFIQVKNIYDAKFKALDQVNRAYSNDAALKAAKIKEIEDSHNAQISALLTPAQNANFIAYLQSTGTTASSTTK